MKKITWQAYLAINLLVLATGMIISAVSWGKTHQITAWDICDFAVWNIGFVLLLNAILYGILAVRSISIKRIFK